MRILSFVLLIFTAFGAALAHPLGSEATLGEQLTHQAIGAHHLPLLLLFVVLAIAIVRKLRKN